MATEVSDGWNLEGIPKPFWPHVRDVLVARDLYKLAALVSDRTVSQTLAQTAEGLLGNSARHLAVEAQTKK